MSWRSHKSDFISDWNAESEFGFILVVNSAFNASYKATVTKVEPLITTNGGRNPGYRSWKRRRDLAFPVLKLPRHSPCHAAVISTATNMGMDGNVVRKSRAAFCECAYEYTYIYCTNCSSYPYHCYNDNIIRYFKLRIWRTSSIIFYVYV